jgi:transcriptional regulator with XRE-family HTH domain
MQPRTVADVLAGNIRAYRLLRGLDQAKVADRMTVFEFPWRQSTVSEVEHSRRAVAADELVVLAVCLETTVERLLDSRGPERRDGPAVALGYDGAFATQPELIVGLLCAHKVYTGTHWRDRVPLLYSQDRRPSLTDVGEREEPS